MKLYLVILTFTALVLTPTANATPILSSDGSLLSNVEYDGGLYDVNFVDGVFVDYFPVAQVSSPDWYDQAQAMSAALLDALSSLADRPSPTDINGCSAGVYCLFLLPLAWS